MTREIDTSKGDLSDEDIAYLRTRGTREQQLEAGLLDPNTGFQLNYPGRLQDWEKDGSPMPVFDHDSKIAEESVGDPNEPQVLLPSPQAQVTPVATEPYTPTTGETVAGPVKADVPPPPKATPKPPKA